MNHTHGVCTSTPHTLTQTHTLHTHVQTRHVDTNVHTSINPTLCCQPDKGPSPCRGSCTQLQTGPSGTAKGRKELLTEQYQLRTCDSRVTAYTHSTRGTHSCAYSTHTFHTRHPSNQNMHTHSSHSPTLTDTHPQHASIQTPPAHTHTHTTTHIQPHTSSAHPSTPFSPLCSQSSNTAECPPTEAAP